MEPGFAASALMNAPPAGDKSQRRRTLIRAAAMLLRGVEQEEENLAVELQCILRRLEEIAAEPGDGQPRSGPGSGQS